MPRNANIHLTRGVLRRLLQQAGLPPSAATQLLRRINSLGSDKSRDDDADDVASDSDGSDSSRDDDADNVASESDGYDTVCDCDDSDYDAASGAAPVRVGSSNMNNSGNQSGRQSDIEPLEALHSNAAGAVGVSNPQSRMDSVIKSAFQSVRSAYDSLLELGNSRRTQQLNSAGLTNSNDGNNLDDDRNTEDSESTAVEKRFNVASSLNESTNCRRKVASPQTAEITTSSPPICTGFAPPPPSPDCSSIDQAADQLIRIVDSEKGPEAQEDVKRWFRTRRNEIHRQRADASPPAANRLAERLDNLELLLLVLQQHLEQSRQKGRKDKDKLDALAELKRNLGCLQARLLQLQAWELSQCAGDQHKRLDRTWNFRRDWKAVEPKQSFIMTEPVPGLRRRPAKRDRWLLKFLPARQRRILPELMRSVGFHDLASMAGTAEAGAIPATRARGRPVVASHNMRDPRNDVIQRFLHALKP